MYYKNLEDLIFRRHKQNNADELLILGGFIGVYPIEKMSKENIKTTVIFGCIPLDSNLVIFLNNLTLLLALLRINSLGEFLPAS